MDKVTQLLREDKLNELATKFAEVFGKLSVDDLIEATMDTMKVKKGRRPHAKKLLSKFIEKVENY